MSEKIKKGRGPNRLEALIPIVALLAIMIMNYIFKWGADPHIPVVIACTVAMIIERLCGLSYKNMLARQRDRKSVV